MPGSGDGLDMTPGKTVLACIRKESVRADRTTCEGALPGTIAAMSFLGVAEEYIVDIQGVSLRAMQPAAGFKRGDAVHAAMAPDDWIVLP